METHSTPSQLDGVVPLFHIILCAYNPVLKIFEIEVDSIGAQTFQSWTCEVRIDGGSQSTVNAVAAVLLGDPRFQLTVNVQQLGPFHNFEALVTQRICAAAWLNRCRRLAKDWENLPRRWVVERTIGSITGRRHSCAAHQSASCSENLVILFDVLGRTPIHGCTRTLC
jgi:hypothetical protein